MNYNNQQNYFPPSSSGRRLIKRPTETPGLESTRNTQPAFPPVNNTQYAQNYPSNTFQNISQPYPPNFAPTMPPNEFSSMPPNEFSSMPPQNMGFNMPPQTRIFSDPMVANMAVQYGQALVGSGKQMMDKEIEKYVSISRLKYLFAVDTSYVSKKMSIILFPFLHSDWSIKYDQNEPIPPKYEVNAPDLYIPAMAFLTYVLVAGLLLGTRNLFTPEKLSIEATNALAWTVLEVIVQLITLYITNINTNLKTLDLIAYSSYKYVGIILIMIVSLLFGHVGYVTSLVYISASLAFFLMRTLKLQILAEPVSTQSDMYGMPQHSDHQVGLKRRQYFLLVVACTQPLLIWWFTWRIV